MASAKNADKLGGKTAADLTATCDPQTVDLGTWCLQAAPYPLPNEDIGKNDFFYASKACVEAGGFLPSADQLLGAADRVKLASTIDDVVVELLARRRPHRRPEGPPRDVLDADHHAGGLLAPRARRASPKAPAATPRRASRTRSRCPPTRRRSRCST